MENQYKYGTCECGGELAPVWFEEEEHVVRDGNMYRTGRKRTACSHLVCIECFKNYCVDGTFDGPWRE